MIKLIFGETLEKLKQIADKSVDLIAADLPYGTTACKWDSVIDLTKLWIEYKRIIKDNGPIVLNAAQPFTSELITSNYDMFKYTWVWQKSKSSNYAHAKNMPLKFHEDICVFSKAPVGHKSQLGDRRMIYNPQGLIKVDKVWKRKKKYDSEHNLKRKSHKLERIIEYTNYPKTVLTFGNSDNNERNLHPTQKPVALMEYIIKTYSFEGNLILDNTMGSGTTGVACQNTNRNFIGIDNNEIYFNRAVKRILKNTNNPSDVIILN